MKESASQRGGFGFPEGRGNNVRRLVDSLNLHEDTPDFPPPSLDDCTLDVFSSRDITRGAELRNAARVMRPVQQLRHLVEEGQSGILVCKNLREVQRSYYLMTRGRRADRARTFIIHERMPVHQQSYVLECMDLGGSCLTDCPMQLITTADYLPKLMDQMPWLMDNAKVIAGVGCRRVSTGFGCEVIIASTVSAEDRNSILGDPTVSCICLREGEGGRWLLTDHDDAAVVRPDEMPAPHLLPRLLNHCVDISGHQLAPFIARNFDVPALWKIYPELVTRSLLIFRKNRCVTGSDMPGVPKAITWSDALGLIY